MSCLVWYNLEPFYSYQIVHSASYPQQRHQFFHHKTTRSWSLDIKLRLIFFKRRRDCQFCSQVEDLTLSGCSALCCSVNLFKFVSLTVSRLTQIKSSDPEGSWSKVSVKSIYIGCFTIFDKYKELKNANIAMRVLLNNDFKVPTSLPSLSIHYLNPPRGWVSVI